MSANVGGGKGKKSGIVLNLTSMIDVCAIIIIFLVLGTVFGVSSVEAPADLKLPKSYNKDMVENAPQIIIRKDKVDILFLHRNIDLVNITENKEEKLKVLNAEIKKYIEEMSTQAKSSGVLLNIISDKMIDYKTIYDVSNYFRSAGFQSMLYVAEGN